MCRNVDIPPVNYIEDIAEALEARNPQQDSSGLEIGDFTRQILDANETVERESECLFEFDADAYRFQIPSANGTVHYAPRVPYENMLALPQLGRRRDRPFLPKGSLPHPESEQFMLEWLHLSYVSADKPPAPESTVPDEVSRLVKVVKSELPARLDADSWIGQLLRRWYGLTEDDMPDGEIRAYEPWMGENGGTTNFVLPNGETRNRYGCWPQNVGPGCFVFVPKHGVELPLNAESLIPYDNVGKLLKALGETLISLSRRIPRMITQEVVVLLEKEYAEIKAPFMTRDQIGLVVREVLGEAWFDVPFDHEHRLKAWSEDDVVKPDDEYEYGYEYPFIDTD